MMSISLSGATPDAGLQGSSGSLERLRLRAILTRFDALFSFPANKDGIGQESPGLAAKFDGRSKKFLESMKILLQENKL